MRYEVIDNFMPEDFHNSLWKVYQMERFPWFYGAKTNYDPECPYIEQEESLDDYHFIHHFYDNDRPVSPFHEQLILPLLREMGLYLVLESKQTGIQEQRLCMKILSIRIILLSTREQCII